MESFVGFCGRFFLCGFCGFCIAKVGYDYMVWVLIRKFMVWPFVLQFSSFPFRFQFVVPSDGCPPCVEVDFSDLEAYLFFAVFFFW